MVCTLWNGTPQIPMNCPKFKQDLSGEKMAIVCLSKDYVNIEMDLKEFYNVRIFTLLAEELLAYQGQVYSSRFNNLL